MPVLGKLNLENVVYYKSATIDLGYEGVTYVSGRNLNSKLNGRNNGSGKSLLFSPIANILKSVLPSHEKNARALKHSMFTSGSSVTLEFKDQHHEYSLTKAMPKSSVKWDILEDGKEMKHPTSTKAENFAQSLCPLNEQEFFSTVYLDSRRPNTMHVGTSSERFNFFSDLFRLHDYDNIKKYFSTRIKELDEARIKRDALVEQMADVAYVTKFNERKKRTDLKEAEKEVKDLQSEITDVSAELGSIKLFLANEDSLSLIKGHSAKDIKQKLKDLKALRSTAKAYEKYVEALEEYEERRGKLESILKKCAKLGKSHSCGSPKEVKSKLKAYEKEIAELESRKKDLKREIKNAVEELDEFESTIEEVAKLDKKIGGHKKLDGSGKYEARIEAAREHVTAIEEFLDGKSDGNCTVCGGKFSKKDAKSKLKDLEKEVESNRKLLKTARSQERDLDDRKELGKVKLKDLEKKASGLRSKVTDFTKERDKIKLPKVDLDELEELAGKWKQYGAMLEDLDKPKKVDKCKKSVDDVDDEISDLKKVLNVMDTLGNMMGDIEKGRKLCGSDKPKKARAKRQERLDELQTRVGKLSSKILDVNGELAKYDSDKETYEKLDKKRRKIEESLTDIEIFDALVEAYGSKGLKVLAIKNIKTFIEKNMNKYSSLLFPERFEFNIDVGINQFDIMVTRHSKGKKLVSDVRHLSGSESRSFCLLWLISILPLIPQERRYNICVLDEYESNMDLVTREMLCKDFIPALTEVVPHIVFISPYADIPIDHHNVRKVVVEKSGGISKLIYD
ncbi:hypothetical protein GR11A_00164 [Vibrio phage vB_VcorM_GR11A]|nr:hypothetical protein GR11A_00164 [Vibrio phage vB_VcorM_GR11A]